MVLGPLENKLLAPHELMGCFLIMQVSKASPYVEVRTCAVLLLLLLLCTALLRWSISTVNWQQYVMVAFVSVS